MRRLTVVALVLLFACGEPEVADVDAAANALQRLLPVEPRVIAAEDGYLVRVAYAGRVVSGRSSQLGFERGGRLKEVFVDEGERVEAGAVLARLDTRELESRRNELEAQVTESRARLELAGLTDERRKKLLANQSISPQRRDEARYDALALAARLAAAEAAIESVDVSLDLSQLVAPYTGSITARRADEGSIVSPGDTILHIIEAGALELRVGLPPETAATLDRERAYDVLLDGSRHPVRVRTLLDTVEPDTRTVTAIFEFAKQPEGLRSGSLARVEVETFVTAEGFWLPLTALSESRRGLWSAYALVGNGDSGVRQVERRELQVLYVDSERAYVRGTLRPGEQVVAGGLHRLVPGQQVRLAQ